MMVVSFTETGKMMSSVLDIELRYIQWDIEEGGVQQTFSVAFGDARDRLDWDTLILEFSV